MRTRTRTATTAAVAALLAGVLTVGAATQGAADPQAARQLAGDQRPRLAVVSAFAPELERLLAEARVTRTETVNGRTFHVGELRGVPVVMFLTGVSMVNAAMMTQAAVDRFRLTGIVFSGIAGGVNPALDVGDVTVPARWAQYQESLYARETAPGEYDWRSTGFHTNEFGSFGMAFPQRVGVTSAGGQPDVESQKFWFDVDPEMLAVAREAAGRVELERCTARGTCLSGQPDVVVGGAGVSGPTFVDNAAYRDWAWSTFRADALDMETAAVAHVAYASGVPMVAFRSLSDLAGGGDGANELPVFFELAAGNSARVVTAFLDAWRTRGRG